MAEGTSIDSLDDGKVENEADAGRMRDILRDMNASGAETGGDSQQRQQQQQQPMPQYSQPQFVQPQFTQPHFAQQQQVAPPSHYVPVYDNDKPSRNKKRNVWSSVLSYIQDPFVVAFLVFVVSLPVLHTFLAKYATWAFAVGGQLSWFGLIIKSLFVGLMFGLYKAANYLFE